MALNRFCTDEQIVKAIKKRFKDMDFYLVSPELLFLEEFIIFLEESAAIDGLSQEFIMESAQQKYNELTKAERMRYINLATDMNSIVFAEFAD